MADKKKPTPMPGKAPAVVVLANSSSKRKAEGPPDGAEPSATKTVKTAEGKAPADNEAARLRKQAQQAKQQQSKQKPETDRDGPAWVLHAMLMTMLRRFLAKDEKAAESRRSVMRWIASLDLDVLAVKRKDAPRILDAMVEMTVVLQTRPQDEKDRKEFRTKVVLPIIERAAQKPGPGLIQLLSEPSLPQQAKGPKDDLDIPPNIVEWIVRDSVGYRALPFTTWCMLVDSPEATGLLREIQVFHEAVLKLHGSFSSAGDLLPHEKSFADIKTRGESAQRLASHVVGPSGLFKQSGIIAAASYAMWNDLAMAFIKPDTGAVVWPWSRLNSLGLSSTKDNRTRTVLMCAADQKHAPAETGFKLVHASNEKVAAANYKKWGVGDPGSRPDFKTFMEVHEFLVSKHLAVLAMARFWRRQMQMATTHLLRSSRENSWLAASDRLVRLYKARGLPILVNPQTARRFLRALATLNFPEHPSLRAGKVGPLFFRKYKKNTVYPFHPSDKLDFTKSVLAADDWWFKQLVAIFSDWRVPQGDSIPAKPVMLKKPIEPWQLDWTRNYINNPQDYTGIGGEWTDMFTIATLLADAQIAGLGDGMDAELSMRALQFNNMIFRLVDAKGWQIQPVGAHPGRNLRKYPVPLLSDRVFYEANTAGRALIWLKEVRDIAGDAGVVRLRSQVADKWMCSTFLSPVERNSKTGCHMIIHDIDTLLIAHMQAYGMPVSTSASVRTNTPLLMAVYRKWVEENRPFPWFPFGGQFKVFAAFDYRLSDLFKLVEAAQHVPSSLVPQESTDTAWLRWARAVEKTADFGIKPESAVSRVEVDQKTADAALRKLAALRRQTNVVDLQGELGAWAESLDRASATVLLAYAKTLTQHAGLRETVLDKARRTAIGNLQQLGRGVQEGDVKWRPPKDDREDRIRDMVKDMRGGGAMDLNADLQLHPEVAELKSAENEVEQLKADIQNLPPDAKDRADVYRGLAEKLAVAGRRFKELQQAYAVKADVRSARLDEIDAMEQKQLPAEIERERREIREQQFMYDMDEDERLAYLEEKRENGQQLDKHEQLIFDTITRRHRELEAALEKARQQDEKELEDERLDEEDDREDQDKEDKEEGGFQAAVMQLGQSESKRSAAAAAADTPMVNPFVEAAERLLGSPFIDGRLNKDFHAPMLQDIMRRVCRDPTNFPWDALCCAVPSWWEIAHLPNEDNIKTPHTNSWIVLWSALDQLAQNKMIPATQLFLSPDVNLPAAAAASERVLHTALRNKRGHSLMQTRSLYEKRLDLNLQQLQSESDKLFAGVIKQDGKDAKGPPDRIGYVAGLAVQVVDLFNKSVPEEAAVRVPADSKWITACIHGEAKKLDKSGMMLTALWRYLLEMRTVLYLYGQLPESGPEVSKLIDATLQSAHGTLSRGGWLKHLGDGANMLTMHYRFTSVGFKRFRSDSKSDLLDGIYNVWAIIKSLLPQLDKDSLETWPVDGTHAVLLSIRQRRGCFPGGQFLLPKFSSEQGPPIPPAYEMWQQWGAILRDHVAALSEYYALDGEDMPEYEEALVQLVDSMWQSLKGGGESNFGLLAGELDVVAAHRMRKVPEDVKAACQEALRTVSIHNLVHPVVTEQLLGMTREDPRRWFKAIVEDRKALEVGLAGRHLPADTVISGAELGESQGDQRWWIEFRDLVDPSANLEADLEAEAAEMEAAPNLPHDEEP